MFNIIYSILVFLIFAFIVYQSYWAKRLTVMKDDKAVQKIIDNKNVERNGLMSFYYLLAIIFFVSYAFHFIF